MDYISVDQYISSPLYIQPVVAMGSAPLSCSRIADLATNMEKSHKHILNKNYKHAIDLLDGSIREIGLQYFSSNTADDTGLKLILANKETNEKRAAYLKYSVLESRLAMLNNKHQCDKSISSIKSDNYIGNAWMEESGEIVLQLFLPVSTETSGHAVFHYKKDHPKYNEILQHLNGLRPGEHKGVLSCPWHDPSLINK